MHVKKKKKKKNLVKLTCFFFTFTLANRGSGEVARIGEIGSRGEVDLDPELRDECRVVELAQADWLTIDDS